MAPSFRWLARAEAIPNFLVRITLRIWSQRPKRVRLLFRSKSSSIRFTLHWLGGRRRNSSRVSSRSNGCWYRGHEGQFDQGVDTTLRQRQQGWFIRGRISTRPISSRHRHAGLSPPVQSRPHCHTNSRFIRPNESSQSVPGGSRDRMLSVVDKSVERRNAIIRHYGLRCVGCATNCGVPKPNATDSCSSDQSGHCSQGVEHCL